MSTIKTVGRAFNTIPPKSFKSLSMKRGTAEPQKGQSLRYHTLFFGVNSHTPESSVPDKGAANHGNHSHFRSYSGVRLNRDFNRYPRASACLALNRHAVILAVKDLQSFAYVAETDTFTRDFRQRGLRSGRHTRTIVFHFDHQARPGQARAEGDGPAVDLVGDAVLDRIF